MKTSELIQWRTRWSLTQQQLADALEVSTRTIQNLESQDPDSEVARRTTLALEALEARYTSGPPSANGE